MKTAVTGTDLTPHDMALLVLLKESKNLNRYFSDSERMELKEKLRELKKRPGSRQLAEMIHYISDMTAIVPSRWRDG